MHTYSTSNPTCFLIYTLKMPQFVLLSCTNEALTMQKMLRPYQAAVSNSREQQSSRHTQDTLTSIPAQHY